MTSSPERTAVPQDAEGLTAFVSTFTNLHGFPPIAGGEVAPPPVEPMRGAEPGAAAPVAPAPGPAGAPGAIADPGQPGGAQQPGAAPAEQVPEWAQNLNARMDAILPQAPVDPLLADLGVAPRPALPGQPAAQPGVIPGPYDPALPGLAPQQQPGAPLPGQPGPQSPGEAQIAEVNAYIDARAEQKAQAIIDARINPRFEELRERERRADFQGLRQDYPELNQPQVAQALSERVGNWAQLVGTPDLVREPAFVEMSLLAAEAMDARQRAAAAGTPAVPSPGQPGVVPIEQPGAAAPGSVGDPNQERATRIVAAGRDQGLNPLWR